MEGAPSPSVTPSTLPVAPRVRARQAYSRSLLRCSTALRVTMETLAHEATRASPESALEVVRSYAMRRTYATTLVFVMLRLALARTRPPPGAPRAATGRLAMAPRPAAGRGPACRGRPAVAWGATRVTGRAPAQRGTPLARV